MTCRCNQADCPKCGGPRESLGSILADAKKLTARERMDVIGELSRLRDRLDSLLLQLRVDFTRDDRRKIYPSGPLTNCPACNYGLQDAPGLGQYCPNPACDRIDDLWIAEKAGG